MIDALAANALRIGLFRFTLAPSQPLEVPAVNKGNMIRGGFGHAFRRLCCIPQCTDARVCPLNGSCPYKAVFEPSPPPGSGRLSKNQDIPRPFVFRPPLDVPPGVASAVAPGFSPAPAQAAIAVIPTLSGVKGRNPAPKTRYKPGERFQFGLVLIGRALDFLPYFVLSFRELAREGLGLNRAVCELENVTACNFDERAVAGVYHSSDQTFHTPAPLDLAAWIERRMQRLGPSRITVRFLTPTHLTFEGQIVKQPEFHHLFKRVRDRLNALSTFYGDGPIDADFKGLGERAEKVRTVASRIEWAERFRTSSKTHQRHEISGFVGECTYEFPNSESGTSNLESGISNLELLQWLICGELLHVGKHAAWGNGW
jgi:hypothetical protein